MASISNIFKKISDFFNDGELQNAPKLNGSLAEQNTAKKSNPSGSSPGYSFVQPKSGSKSGSTSSGNASVFTRNTSTGSTGSKDSTKPSTPSTAGFMFNRSTESTTPKPGKTSFADQSTGKTSVRAALDSSIDSLATKRRETSGTQTPRPSYQDMRGQGDTAQERANRTYYAEYGNYSKKFGQLDLSTETGKSEYDKLVKELDDRITTLRRTPVSADNPSRTSDTGDYTDSRVDADALQWVKDDLESWGRKASVATAKRANRELQQQADDFINTVFAGVIESPDYERKAQEGIEKAESAFGAKIFGSKTDNMTETQKKLYGYTYATQGKSAANELFEDFLEDYANYDEAVDNFEATISKDSKFGRGVSLFGETVSTGLDQWLSGAKQTFKDTSVEESDDLIGSYSANDAADNYIRQQYGNILDDAEFLRYADTGMTYAKTSFASDPWYKENVADASDLQQKLYGYVLAGYGEDAAKQTMEGINSWKQSVKDVVKGDGALAASAQSQEGALYREYLGLTGASAPGINATSDEDTTVAQVIWDLGVTTANQIPQWAAVLAGSYVGGPALGRILGAAVMGTGVYGNSYNQSIKEGYSEKQATIYAATQAAMEGGVSILLDGVGKTAGVLTTKALGTEVFQNITNPWVKAFADLGIRAASEGTEEYIQEIADPIIRNIVLDENNDFNLMSDEAKYSFILGALSAGLIDMVNLNVNIKSNVTAERLGNALNTVGADSKLVDTILNNPVEADDALGITKEQAKLYGEAKSMAEGIKSGTIKATGMNVGKMTQLYGAAGGDLGFLTNPSTVSYNKSQLTSGDLEAGAKARLVQLNADTKTADVIVKLAMGEQVSAEEQAVFDAEPQAKTVLSELQGELDMSNSKNALSMAAAASTLQNASSKAYQAIVANNSDKAVTNPTSQAMMQLGMKYSVATQQSTVINKVLDGQSITAKEAGAVIVKSPIVRKVIADKLGIELSESSTAADVMTAFNSKAAEMATIATQQKALKQTAKATAKAQQQTAAEKAAAIFRRNDNGSNARGTDGSTQSVGESRSRGDVQAPAAVGRSEGAAGVAERAAASDVRFGRGDAGVLQRAPADASLRPEQIIPAEDLTDEQRSTKRSLAEKGFGNIIFFRKGDNGYAGRTFFNSETQTYDAEICANGQFTADQYGEHEGVHLWLKSLSNSASVVDGIVRNVFGEAYRELRAQYWDAYSDKYESLNTNAFMRAINEEMLCDAYAGMSKYGYDYTEFQAKARELVESEGIMAAGMGDVSNPKVQEYAQNGELNATFYERMGYSLEADDSVFAIDESVEKRTSKLIEVLENDKAKNAPWNQNGDGKVMNVRKFLERYGVSREEMRWLQLDKALEGKDRINRYELIDLMRANMLEIQVRELSGEDLRQSGYTLPGGENQREVLFILPGEDYTNSSINIHWNEGKGKDEDKVTNVLAHARVDDRTIGEDRTLYIDEIQSDWHNEGSKTGYLSDDAAALEKKQLKHYTDELSQVFQQLHHEKLEIDPDSNESVTAQVKARLNEVYTKQGKSIYLAFADPALAPARKIDNVKSKGPYPATTPDAPFETNYAEFVMKSLIKRAIDDGYDMLAWSSAAIQSERWSVDYQSAYENMYNKQLVGFMGKFGKQFGIPVVLKNIDVTPGTVSRNKVTEQTPASKEYPIWTFKLNEQIKDSLEGKEFSLFAVDETGMDAQAVHESHRADFRLDPGNDYAEYFYSPLVRFINDRPKNAKTGRIAVGNADQFVKAALNAGIKQDEVTFSGLREFLSGRRDFSPEEFSEWYWNSQAALETWKREGADAPWGGFTYHGGSDYHTIELVLPQYRGYVTSDLNTHFEGDRDVAAHARISHQQNRNGEAVVHIEEAQSDLANAGRKDGETFDAPLRKSYPERMMKQAIAEALENGFDYVTWTPAIAQSVRWSFDYNGAYRNTYDTAMVKAAKKFGTVSEERLGNYYGEYDSDFYRDIVMEASIRVGINQFKMNELRGAAEDEFFRRAAALTRTSEERLRELGIDEVYDTVVDYQLESYREIEDMMPLNPAQERIYNELKELETLYYSDAEIESADTSGIDPVALNKLQHPFEFEWTRESAVETLRAVASGYTDGDIPRGETSTDTKGDHTVDILEYYADALEGRGDPVWVLAIDKDKVADGMSLYAIDEDIEELMGVDEESIEARNAKEAIAYEEGFSTDDVTLDEDIYWDELLDKLDGMSASEKAAVWSNYLAYQERSTTKIKPDKRTKEYREGTDEEAADTKETSSDADFDLGDKRVFDENAELSDEAYNRAWDAYEKRTGNDEAAPRRNKFPVRKAEEKPEAAKETAKPKTDAFKPKEKQTARKDDTASPEPRADVFKAKQEAKPTPVEAKAPAAETVSETPAATVKTAKKVGRWAEGLAKAKSGAVNRRALSRNTYNIMLLNPDGTQTRYDDISPSMLQKIFGKQKADEITTMANQNIGEDTWSFFSNEKEQPKAEAKPETAREKDTYGRKVAPKLAEYMKDSKAREGETGALIPVYRLASAAGVRNAKIPGKATWWTDKPAVANTHRGLSGAAAYGQEGKRIGSRIAAINSQLEGATGDRARALRTELARAERRMREYTNGVTRLDPYREAFTKAKDSDIINGMALLEGYVNITKPLTIDAKGKGADFVEAETRRVMSDPELKAKYDGIIFKNANMVAEGATLGGGSLDASTVYVTFENKQGKSTYNTAPTDSALMQYALDEDFDTGYTEGTLEDLVLKMLHDKDENHALAALTEYFSQLMQTGDAPEVEDPARMSKVFQPRVSSSEQIIIRNQLDSLIREYGAIPAGEKAARDVRLPNQTGDGVKVRRFLRTAAEAEQMPDHAVDHITRMTLTDEGASYVPITDRSAISYADRQFRKKGYDRILGEWDAHADLDYMPKKQDIALGEMLFKEAAKVGDYETAMRVLADVAEMGTKAGQVVQAMSLLKKMTPQGQLYYFQRTVDRLNADNRKRIESGRMEQLIINRDLAKQVMEASTQEELAAAMDALIQDIADQIPATFTDKWNAWRYLAMLGNPRTHIRNIVGNSIFVPAKFMKDLIAAGLENTFIPDMSQRTKSVSGVLGVGTEKYKTFANADFALVKDELTGGGKYNQTDAIRERRTIYKLRPLEWLRRKNGEWLEKEDAAFLKAHYVNALTSYLAAQNADLIDIQTTREGARILNAAREYAINEAQKATYRDYSALAAGLNKIKRIPGAGILAEGLVPFTKTPLNVLKRGVEYSPLGLMKTVSYDLYKLRKGDMTANQFIDHIAAGMTGSMITLLGLFLASRGILRGSGDDDDKQNAFEKLQGYQDYSVTIGGVNYTIDWTAPVAMPLFVGAEMWKTLEDGKLSFGDIAHLSTVVIEPLTTLSMLDGLNSALKANRYDDYPLTSIAVTMGASYVAQAVPTLLGQISRSLVADRRMTYIDKNSDVPATFQRWWQTNIVGKTPLNAGRTAYVDAWGRRDTTGSFIVRLLENMLSPGYSNKIQTTPVDDELQRLADNLGTEVLISDPDKDFSFEGTKYNLSAEQYEELATVRGQVAYGMLSDLMNDIGYSQLSDEAKAKAIDNLVSYATYSARKSVMPEYDTDQNTWIEKCDGDESRVMYMAMMKALASEADITASNNSDFYSLILNTPWLGTTDQSYMLAQTWYLSGSYLTDSQRRGYQFLLDKEQREEVNYLYRTIFPNYFVEMVSTDEWWYAETMDEKLAMLKEVRDSSAAEARAIAQQRLRDAGVQSVPKQ